MCGIFGFFIGEASGFSALKYNKLLRQLFKLSESRGKEAAGIAMVNEYEIRILKDAIPASKFIKGAAYQNLLRHFSAASKLKSLGAIGHSRLVTNGLQAIEMNNQPFSKHGMVCVHNGIVVNVDEIWQQQLPDYSRLAQVDTEVILSLMHKYVQAGSSIEMAIKSTFSEIYGETTIAVLFEDQHLLALATNTGSLHYLFDSNRQILIFASEIKILEKLLLKYPELNYLKCKQLKPNESLMLDTIAFTMAHNAGTEDKSINIQKTIKKREIIDSWQQTQEKREQLRRCSKCILPETVPNISFDANGVCSFCNSYAPRQLQGHDALEAKLGPYRKNNGEPDCIVAFSGGRDSSYGLHYIKNEMNMTPLAFSYDWGLITDLARRNQSRMCSALGIEHIWLSANIGQKRRNVRRNVNAWLKKPDLGMIPLFMAGDKQFMHYVNQLMKSYNIKLMLLCENHLEKTDFKSGFAGVKPQHKNKSVYRISKFNKIRLLSYYMKQFLTNPGYLNSSLLDTAFAFFSYYMSKQDYLFLFDYIDWNEDHINDVLINTYDWETSKDSSSTWRIGDGTAPFYNYIYYTVAGFTEFDTFRSNQVREGIITRDEALEFVKAENQPRWASIKEYTEIIGADFDRAVTTINNIPKLYMPEIGNPELAEDAY